VLVSVVAGGIVGAKVAEHLLKKRHAPEMWNQSVMHALQRHLKLTPAQAQKVQAIIDGGVGEMKTIRLETITRTDVVVERLIADIDRELTPEQSAELQKLKAQRGATTIDMLKVEPRKK
jgi:Spy/CpxP family protein refolding chaperone